MKPKRNGFTVVELLTVLAIIAILVGILVPTVSFVRNSAAEARQKTQLATIDMALMAFRGDYGDYPPSYLNSVESDDYCGAQKLAEALVGWDLLGFHPESDWTGDDVDGVYDLDGSTEQIKDNLNERIGPYLELGTTSCFTLEQLFGTGISTTLALNTYVLCDSFAVKTVTIVGASKTITTKAGRPILYYRANKDSKNFIKFGFPDGKIYNSSDNYEVIWLKKEYEETDDPLAGNAGAGTSVGSFLYSEYYKLKDPKVTARPWPYRPDSYVLISAGVDGLYGTNDDITNF